MNALLELCCRLRMHVSCRVYCVVASLGPYEMIADEIFGEKSKPTADDNGMEIPTTGDITTATPPQNDARTQTEPPTAPAPAHVPPPIHMPFHRPLPHPTQP